MKKLLVLILSLCMLLMFPLSVYAEGQTPITEVLLSLNIQNGTTVGSIKNQLKEFNNEKYTLNENVTWVILGNQGEWMGSSSALHSGRTYTISIHLKAEDGYYFNVSQGQSSYNANVNPTIVVNDVPVGDIEVMVGSWDDGNFRVINSPEEAIYSGYSFEYTVPGKSSGGILQQIIQFFINLISSIFSIFR